MNALANQQATGFTNQQDGDAGKQKPDHHRLPRFAFKNRRRAITKLPVSNTAAAPSTMFAHSVQCAGHALVRLLRRLAVELFGIGLGFRAGRVDDTVTMIRRRVERVQPERRSAGVDDVVSGPGRHEDGETGPDRRSHAIENRFSGPFLDAKELVERVDFRPDRFAGL